MPPKKKASSKQQASLDGVLLPKIPVERKLELWAQHNMKARLKNNGRHVLSLGQRSDKYKGLSKQEYENKARHVLWQERAGLIKDPANRARAQRALAQEMRPKRSDQYVLNVQGLFRDSSNANFHSHSQALMDKYKKNQAKLEAIRARIRKAQNLRTAGVTPQRQKEKQTKIQAESKAKKGAGGPVGLCAAEVQEGKNPFLQPCWIDGIKKEMDPILEQIKHGIWMCGKDALGPHQKVAVEAAKLMANTQGDPGPTDRRGLLVYHNTGSGKTNTAMGIMAAFWNSPKKIFFVTSNENSKNNPLSEYAKLALVFYPEYANVVFGSAPYLPPTKMWNVAAYKARETFKDPDGNNTTFAEWCVKIGGPIISKRLSGGKIISFWVFAGATKHIDKLKTEGAVLIIDESQNMFKPRSSGAESEALGYMAKHLPTEAFMKKSFVFPLTATPGDTAGQVLSMINVVRPWGMPPVTSQQFVANPQIIRGLISYADVRGDRTHYGHLSGPDKKPINKYVTFEPRYFAALLAEMKGYKEATDLDANPGDSKKFYIKSMVGSCILGAKKVKDLYKGDDAAYEKLLSAKINGRTEVVFSSKMEAIFKAIESTRGCQYLYVPDPNVLKATVDVMQNRLGYERITGDQKYLKQVSKGSKKAWEIDPNLGEKKRFYAFYPGTMDGVPGDAEQMKAVLDFFKSSKNKYGERIKLFVGTVFEGLDMGWLQAVHLASPLPSTADDDQAVGRALRYCGHDPAAKEVAVYRYFGVAPKTLDNVNAKPAKQKAIDLGLEMLANADERGVNVHVYRDALRRGKPMNDFMMCIRGQSIECEADAEHGGILAAAQYGEKTRCGVKKCDVKLDAKGELVVEKPTPGKHGNTIHNSPGGRHKKPPRPNIVPSPPPRKMSKNFPEVKTVTVHNNHGPRNHGPRNHGPRNHGPRNHGPRLPPRPVHHHPPPIPDARFQPKWHVYPNPKPSPAHNTRKYYHHVVPTHGNNRPTNKYHYGTSQRSLIEHSRPSLFTQLFGSSKGAKRGIVA